MKILFLLFVFYTNVSWSENIDLKVNSITKNLRCLVCEGQSVYESNSDFAIDIKKLIKKKISNNDTDDQIYKFLKSKYGEVILLKPEINLKNIGLWILPIIFFFIGGFIILRRDNYEK